MYRAILRPAIAASAVVALLGTALWAANPATAAGDTDIEASARLLAQRAMIVDTHIDVHFRLQGKWSDVTKATADGDFDYERARKGGLDIPFMSIYTPAELEAEGGSYELANRLIDSVEALVGRAPDRFMIVRSPDDADEAVRTGKIGMALGLENGAPIEAKIENLQYFYDRGIRYITLAHGLTNHIADSSYDVNRKWHGLGPFGLEVVAEMNRLGIMVDISHVSDESAAHVLRVSRAPVIASHSSARHFTPGFERNISDELIVALAKNGGVVQINFGSTFLTEKANLWSKAMNEARDAWISESGNAKNSDAAKGWLEDYRSKHSLPYASLSDVADHIDYVAKLVGVEHVGIGSDFDGVGDTLPTGLKDVSTYPALIAELMRRGYTVPQLEGILGGNLMRVWREVEKVAAATSKLAG